MTHSQFQNSKYIVEALIVNSDILNQIRCNATTPAAYSWVSSFRINAEGSVWGGWIEDDGEGVGGKVEVGRNVGGKGKEEKIDWEGR